MYDVPIISTLTIKYRKIPGPNHCSVHSLEVMDLLDPTTWLGTLLILGVVLGASAAIIVTIRALVGRLRGRAAWMADLAPRVHFPAMATVLVSAAWVTSGATAPGGESWWPRVSHVFFIATVVTGTWLLANLVSFGFTRLITHEGLQTTAAARSRRTQLLVLHRLSLVLICVVALGAVLFSFPELRVVGTSLLASAGIVSIMAGLAAQSVLGNLLAGVQIAFTQSIKVDDVVVVEGEWGRIGEINLSYVVVYIWDERRLVLPSMYFVTNPIETWTRDADDVLGIVYMDLDWRVPMGEVRAKFQDIIEGSEHWDHRSSSVYVTGSQGGFVTVRFVMSSRNSDDQWFLCCQVREDMMTWLQTEHPEALPTNRLLVHDMSGA